MIKYAFPADFLWGSSTSAFQVEGDCKNHDFYEWAVKGRIKDGTNPDDAVHHYRKYIEDIELLKAMNHNAARIGLEWARIEPEEGVFDQNAIGHYRDELIRMRNVGLKCMVTIHHFANPLWLTAKGGWKNPTLLHFYLRFVEKVVYELGDLVDFWLTINEPNCYGIMAYFFGEFPPGEKSIPSFFKVSRNMIRAHCLAYQRIHRIHRENNWQEAVVGWSLAWVHFEAAPGNPLHRLGRALAHFLTLSRFINRIKDSLDFIGIQYYRSDLVRFPFTTTNHPDTPKSKLGWDIMPDRFYEVLASCWKKYHLPIYVTENGVCDDNDELRPAYLVSHLYYLWKAIQSGVDVRGYFHWSTLDNFELVDGVCSPFGLVHVDHAHPDRTRTIKPSGRLYAEIIAQGGLTQEMIDEYGDKFIKGYETPRFI